MVERASAQGAPCAAERTLLVDGLPIAFLERLPGTAAGRTPPPVVFLHGFTGSGRSWTGVWEHFEGLGFDRVLYAPDIIGHGRTGAPSSPERYAIQAAANDLAVLLDLLGAPLVDLVGYSMGGRLALYFAASYPGRVRRLVLESATAGIEDPREREERRARDNELAGWIEAHGIEAFVDRWESLPLFASQANLPPGVREAQRKARLANLPRGLANSLRGMGTGAQPPLWEKLGGVRAECLVIAGAKDEKFSAIARRMHELLPGSRLAVAPGAGHNVHLEAPAFFAEAVVAFLSSGVTGRLRSAGGQGAGENPASA